MKLGRRRFLTLIGGVATLPAVSRLATAQTYPARPVRLIAPFPPGGSIDLTARLIGQWLSERLGQQVVVENRAGAGGNVGSEGALNSPADGYTLLLCSVANAISATLYDNLKYNFRDIAPVAGISRAPNVMVLHPSVPAKSVPEFIAYAKANPGKINMASSGVGTSIHMSGELFKLMTGVNMQHVPYRGSAPMLTDLLAGQVQVAFDNLQPSMPHIKAGTLRALAVTTATRSQALPELPTIADFVPGYEASTWNGRVRAQGHTSRNRAKAQSGDQRRAERPDAEGAACRHGRMDVARLNRRRWQAGCRRSRQVGQGDPDWQHQSGVR